MKQCSFIYKVTQDEETWGWLNCIIARTVGFENCPIPYKELICMNWYVIASLYICLSKLCSWYILVISFTNIAINLSISSKEFFMTGNLLLCSRRFEAAQYCVREHYCVCNTEGVFLQDFLKRSHELFLWYW